MNTFQPLIEPSDWERTSRIQELSRIEKRRLGQEESLSNLLKDHKLLVIAGVSLLLLYGAAEYHLNRNEINPRLDLQEAAITLNGDAVRQYLTER